jgi:hypothetical protein
VFDYVERFYHPMRRHSTLGYVSAELEESQKDYVGGRRTGSSPIRHASCGKRRSGRVRNAGAGTPGDSFRLLETIGNVSLAGTAMRRR